MANKRDEPGPKERFRSHPHKKTSGSHRLKQKDLVMRIFFMFEEEYEKQDVESIWNIKIPIERIKDYLKDTCDVNYRSNLWVYTQLKRYEEELGVRLFKKETADNSDNGEFYLSIYDRMLKFYQKQHLYVSKKIKVANAVYDKIKNDVNAQPEKERRIKILLGAGSTIYHLANIIADKSWYDPIRYSIYTHNLGSLKRLLEPSVNYNTIEVFTPSGKVDPVTYTIIGDPDFLCNAGAFDYIAMGTSYVFKGELFVESKQESNIKRAILKEAEGTKLLILTKHEFTDKKPEGLSPYGYLSDYDYVVVPRISTSNEIRKKYDKVFETYRNIFEPEILHWNYSIFKVTG
ncbi:MAG: DeoR family transcriptional regulator [Spirochaetales bacterium]|nr:DeoR family transcriptional regulator [Spirochaetales bacterium]